MASSGMVIQGASVEVPKIKLKFHRDFEKSFLLELLIKDPYELGLLRALQDDPNDEANKNAYVDYLRENGRGSSAEFILKGSVPGGFLSRAFDHAEASSTSQLQGTVVSGAIASGQIGSLYITSGGTFSPAQITADPGYVAPFSSNIDTSGYKDDEDE